MGAILTVQYVGFIHYLPPTVADQVVRSTQFLKTSPKFLPTMERLLYTLPQNGVKWSKVDR